MSYFEFPHTRSYEGDLGFVIKMIIDLTNKFNDFFDYNSIKFADPIEWNITTQYAPYTIVFDTDAGASYISKKPVPAGVLLSNNNFWELVGPLIVDGEARTAIARILNFVTNAYESGTTATALRNPGDFVIVSGNLYKVTAAINIGEVYTEGYNVEAYTIENMINDHFPVDTADITDSAISTAKVADGAISTAKVADGAISTAKVADGAISTAKVADHSINKTKTVTDKYLFIGDSWNADYHYSWGTKLAANMGLTLGVDYWNVAIPGGGFGNGLILSSTQAVVDPLTDAQKNSITKVLIVSGANDAAYPSTSIVNGLTAFETYIKNALPNAEFYLVAGQWGFETATFREGLINAYNAYGENCGVMRFFDKCYLEFMDPYFLESDFIHPTEGGQNIFIHTLKNILKGGNYYERKYTDLVSYVNMTNYYGSMSSGGNIWAIKGDISRAGTHVFTTGNDYIIFNGGYWMQYNSKHQIGVMGSNNLFQRKAELKTTASVVYLDNSQNIRTVVPATVIIERNDSGTLEIFLRFDSPIDGNNTRNIQQVYLPIDQMLDFTKT